MPWPASPWLNLLSSWGSLLIGSQVWGKKGDKKLLLTAPLWGSSISWEPVQVLSAGLVAFDTWEATLRRLKKKKKKISLEGMKDSLSFPPLVRYNGIKSLQALKSLNWGCWLLQTRKQSMGHKGCTSVSSIIKTITEVKREFWAVMVFRQPFAEMCAVNTEKLWHQLIY